MENCFDCKMCELDIRYINSTVKVVVFIHMCKYKAAVMRCVNFKVVVILCVNVKLWLLDLLKVKLWLLNRKCYGY